MAIKDLIPWRRNETSSEITPSSTTNWPEERPPVEQFRRQVDRLFDDFFSFPSLLRDQTKAFPVWPSLEVKENDSEVTVTAELAGLTEKDVEVSVDNGVLTIRGEKTSANEDRDNGWSERLYGSFERQVALPDGADDEKCHANFDNGVLTITMPKAAGKSRLKKIPIGKANN